MALEKCPKCGENAFIKTPAARIMRESLGCMIHVANQYYWECLQCKYRKERVSVNTKMGDHFDLPWYKRIFNFNI
jgi:predicted nucleic-acid-binding Zn-ribbon protein